MFNATELLRRSGSRKVLPNYYRSEGFRMLVASLPPEDIMVATNGKNGCTMLNDVFLVDFVRWLGDPAAYFKLSSRVCPLLTQPQTPSSQVST